MTRWRLLPPCAATRAGVEAAISRARPASAMKQGSTFAGHREAGAVLLRDAGSTDEAPTGMAPGLMDDLTGTTPLHMGTDPDDAGRACAESPDAVVVPVPMAAARGWTGLCSSSRLFRTGSQTKLAPKVKNDVEGLSQASGHCGGRRACGPGVGRRASRCAGGRGRQSMAQCVSRVLSGLARRGAPESQVGPAVLSRCDRPLRASLAESIRSGEAPNCTVETCMDMARTRTVAEAIGAYRQRSRR